MQIIGTGLSGLVGSRIVELLSGSFEFENISRTTGVDITDKRQVSEKIQNSTSPVVLHLAAKTDVDGCEKDKEQGENGQAWKINVLGTQNVVEATLRANKKLIYISTDMVFDGEKPLGQAYSEDDSPSARNWYGQTKLEGEKLILASGCPHIILRIAYPYRAIYEKKEYVRIFYSLLKEKKEFMAITDNYFTPTFIDDIASILQILIEKDQVGIFHAGGGSVVSPYDAALMIADTFGFDHNLIKKTTREIFFKDRAFRPFNTALKNARIGSLNISTHTFAQGLEILKKQIQ